MTGVSNATTKPKEAQASCALDKSVVRFLYEDNPRSVHGDA